MLVLPLDQHRPHSCFSCQTSSWLVWMGWCQAGSIFLHQHSWQGLCLFFLSASCLFLLLTKKSAYWWPASSLGCDTVQWGLSYLQVRINGSWEPRLYRLSLLWIQCHCPLWLWSRPDLPKWWTCSRLYRSVWKSKSLILVFQSSFCKLDSKEFHNLRLACNQSVWETL